MKSTEVKKLSCIKECELICEPYALQVELTYRCNLNCLFCCAPWNDHLDLVGPELSTAQFKEIIGRYTGNNIRMITLTGGEPMLRDDFCELVKFVCAHPSRHQNIVYSNLLALDKSKETVLDEGRVVINTSLQGLDNWSMITNVKGAASLVTWKKNCKRLKSHGLPIITTIVVTKLTKLQLRSMVEFAFDAGADVVQIGALMIEGRARYHPELWLSYAEIKEVEEEVDELTVVYGEKVRPRREFFCKCRADRVLPQGMPSEIDLGECTASDEFIIIGPDGRRRKCMHTWEII